jgi:hypothetical protein
MEEYEVVYMGLMVETKQVLYMGFSVKITARPLEVGVLGLTILYSPPLL